MHKQFPFAVLEFNKMEVAFRNIKIEVEITETIDRDALAKQKEPKRENPLPQKPSNPRVYATILN